MLVAVPLDLPSHHYEALHRVGALTQAHLTLIGSARLVSSYTDFDAITYADPLSPHFVEHPWHRWPGAKPCSHYRAFTAVESIDGLHLSVKVLPRWHHDAIAAQYDSVAAAEKAAVVRAFRHWRALADLCFCDKWECYRRLGITADRVPCWACQPAEMSCYLGAVKAVVQASGDPAHYELLHAAYAAGLALFPAHQ